MKLDKLYKNLHLKKSFINFTIEIERVANEKNTNTMRGYIFSRL